MIYALDISKRTLVSLDERRQIALDIANGTPIDDGRTIHVCDAIPWRDGGRYLCIYCLERVYLYGANSRWTRFNHWDSPSYCIGSDRYLGVLNPRGIDTNCV